ncbi:alpha/beta hydrolase [Herbidospora galbida]|uniref:Alpha/beta hydrolase n=1 Tax=Herbidospora galbida TaxID=2575442 RepID=A0A4U3MI83_9ACTN|nr:alpha/beta hydrolase [Herbidospora galbida]TKK89001.1 alpha/beta hydrolase [Herbidospora galbida]
MSRAKLVGIALVAMTGVGGGGPVEPAGLKWAACAEAPLAPFQCATLTVPLDYADPGKGTLDLAVVRSKATGPRIGSLVFNFGGPGGSGVTTLLASGTAFGSLNRSYDLVSFDPRGVDRSSGIQCLPPKEFEEFLEAEPSLDEATERDLSVEFVQGCQKNAGRILPYVGTVNAAKDMEALRQALGDPKLNYLGFSYGTHLGATYATLYPQKTGRMVLDAALDPTVGLLDQSRTQVLGFQKAYENYLADCKKQPQGCPFGGNAEVVGLLDRLDTTPLVVNGRKVTDDTVRAAIGEALYSKLSWPLLTEALTAAIKGDGTGVQALADQYAGRQPDGTYNTLLSSLNAVLCADTTERPTFAQAEALAKDLSKVSPIFGPDAASAGICSVWPTPGEDSNKRVSSRGTQYPVLVVGAINDPATPYVWAPKLTSELGNAVLLTFEGEGHGAYGQTLCVTGIVDAYLLNGTVPAKGTVCPAA